MVELLSNLIRGKRVLIIGFGKEGQSTYNLIKKIGLYSKIGIADINPLENINETTVYSGKGYLEHIDEYDLAFKSPGVALPKDYREYSCKITSQTEVFLQAFSRQVIGITGTKGKSTVSSLLYHVLHTNQFPCYFAGNIGIPVFEIVEKIQPETIIVLELSCHQLEICSFSPALSVLLNIYEDHLDRYITFENYAKSKKNIYVHQYSLDELYCDKSVLPPRQELKSRTIVVDKSILPFNSLEEISEVKLRGSHNLSNCAFVYSIAKSFGIKDEEFIESLKSYTPLSHRLELLGNKNGVDYYDDSISTTVESTINAIESIPNISTILLGGLDRGIDYTLLVNYLAKSKIDNVICMYESGKRIYGMLKNLDLVNPNVFYCESIFEAVTIAEKKSIPGTACILSPASASYGDFKNFEERGNVFKSLVFKNNLQNEE